MWPCAGKTVRPRSAGAFRAGETQILTSGDVFCVALRRENSPAEIRGSVSRRRNGNFELRRRVLCGPAQGKQSDRVFRAGETQILNCRDAFFVALRRRNANFDLRRRIFCPDECGFTRSQNRMNKIATALQRDAKKNSQHTFRAGETQILTSGVAFSVALRSKKRGAQKKTPRPKRLYPYRKNRSVRHTVWGILTRTFSN